MIIAGFVTTVYRKPGRAFEAVGGKRDDGVTDDGVRSILLTYGIQCKSPIEKGGVSS